jgi:endonuclease/exonuclease/phosphatase (EEP) superfamily protein YafD
VHRDRSLFRRSVVYPARIQWRAIQIGLALYGTATISYLLARFWVGEQWAWVAFANNFVPWWALLGVIAAGIALFSRRRRVLVALQLPILIAFAVWYGDMLWPDHVWSRAASARDENAENSIELTVATFNIRASSSDPVRIAEAIAVLDADIVGVQELNAAHAAVLNGHLAEEFPYQYQFRSINPAGGETNVGILSRYRVIAVERYTPRPNYGRNLRVLVDVEGITVSVYLEHPNSPRHAFSPITYDPWLRDLKIGDLTDTLPDDPNPVLVLCDCNTTDQTAAYRSLDALLVDSFREAGWGLGFTFPAHPIASLPITIPALRIDYVWHSGGGGLVCLADRNTLAARQPSDLPPVRPAAGVRWLPHRTHLRSAPERPYHPRPSTQYRRRR